VPYLSASAVVIHYEEALYQVYAPYLTFTLLYMIDVMALGNTSMGLIQGLEVGRHVASL